MRRGISDRRQVIFAAALRLFREKGFHGTSINAIGAAAGVTGPALYRHFAGKDDVLVEAIREASRHIAVASRAAIASHPSPPLETLRAFVRAHLEVALDDADVHVAFMLEARHLPEKLRKPVHTLDRRFRDDWLRLLRAVRPDLDAEQARTAVSMALFVLTSLCIVPSGLERKAVVAFATDRIMAMLMAPASDPRHE